MTMRFEKYPAVNQASSDKTLYGDIVTHCKNYQQYVDSSKYTSAHECTHGINNDLRLASGDWQGKNGFYVGKDRAIILDEPKFKKSEIAEFIPQELRSARYQLYVAGQESWNDKPLYIFDEGVAYINGAWAAIELKEQENYVEKWQQPPVVSLTTHLGYTRPLSWSKGGNTVVDGHVEFMAYMTAVLMKAQKTGGLAQPLADFSRWLFRHASNAYFRCLKDGFPPFEVQDHLWTTMKTGECFSEQRNFLSSAVGYVFPDGEVPEEDDDNPPWFA